MRGINSISYFSIYSYQYCTKSCVARPLSLPTHDQRKKEKSGPRETIVLHGCIGSILNTPPNTEWSGLTKGALTVGRSATAVISLSQGIDYIFPTGIYNLWSRPPNSCQVHGQG